MLIQYSFNSVNHSCIRKSVLHQLKAMRRYCSINISRGSSKKTLISGKGRIKIIKKKDCIWKQLPPMRLSCQCRDTAFMQFFIFYFYSFMSEFCPPRGRLRFKVCSSAVVVELHWVTHKRNSLLQWSTDSVDELAHLTASPMADHL